MKKILSIFAFVAMLCIPFSLVSCGDDDDPSTSTSGTHGGNGSSSDYQIATYSLDILGSTGFYSDAIELIKQTVEGYFVKIEGTTLTVTNKTAADDLLKKIDKDKLNELVENHSLPVAHFIISYSGSEIFKYEYEKKVGIPVSTGTFAYTDSIGTKWSFVLTDEDAGDGKKVGSIVVPDGVSEVKAGTYAAKWEIRGQGTVALESDLKQDNSENYGRYVVGLTAGFIAGTKEEGVPVTLVANNHTMFHGVYFKQK